MIFLQLGEGEDEIQGEEIEGGVREVLHRPQLKSGVCLAGSV